MINQIPASGTARTPRSILMVGGTKINWTSWDIDHSGIYEAGTIRVDVPAEYPKSGPVDGPLSWAWWIQQTEILVDVYAGFPNDPVNYEISDLTLLMTARIDEVRLDPARQTIELVGRDLTSLFTDSKSDAKYPNMKSSEIILALADKFPVINSTVKKTSTVAGVFYSADQVQMKQQDSMWTLMTYLAQHEGLQCFVLGRTLYFGEYGSFISNEPYGIVFQPPTPEIPFPRANAKHISFKHDLTISGDISVRVRSYHGNEKRANSYTAKPTATLKRAERALYPVQAPQHFDFIFPGLTLDDCRKKAENLLNDISKHEYRMDATVPGDNVTFPWTPVSVTGTGTPFDTTYQISRIKRTFDSRGYSMHMECRTQQAQETVMLS